MTTEHLNDIHKPSRLLITGVQTDDRGKRIAYKAVYPVTYRTSAVRLTGHFFDMEEKDGIHEVSGDTPLEKLINGDPKSPEHLSLPVSYDDLKVRA